MKKISAGIILFLLYSGLLLAQKEGNIWYFGNHAGLDFNPGTPPTVLTDGQIATEEGCASICDSNGNLLFYTDGITVWNRNHNQMPNGTGLYGHSSSTQSGVIVPKPFNKNIYYVFTVTDKSENWGFRYSIVDMTRDGGNGDVIQKNVLLFQPTAEKITAVKHSNGADIWVIGHGWDNNRFYAYLVTKDGINSVENGIPGYPILSNVGMVHTGSQYNKIGYMKASPIGNKICLAINDTSTYQLFDFNNSTGQISNPITFTAPRYSKPYGVEISPNGKVLYVSAEDPPARIYQFDISSGDEATIKSSEKIIAEDPGIYDFSAIQIAPDRKIYCARFNTSYLSVIHNPNALGAACNYQPDAINLLSGVSLWGLPNFIQSIFSFDFDLSTNAPLCYGDTLKLYCDTVDNATYYWYGPAGFTSTQQNPVIINPTPSNSGWYYCEVTSYGLTLKDSIWVIVADPPTAHAGEDKLVCPLGNTSIGEPATGGTPPYTYEWSPATGLSAVNVFNPTASPSAPTEYVVKVTDDNGCIDYDTVQVDFIDPAVQFPDGDTLDFGDFCQNTSKDSTFRIRNVSGFPTTFYIDASGLSPYFSVTGVINDRQFGTGEIRPLAMRFNGADVSGDYLDSVKVIDTCGEAKTFYVKASVIKYDIEINPDTLDLGTFCADETKDTSFTVRNHSGWPALLSADISYLPSYYNIDLSPLSTRFADGEQRQFNISFNGYSVKGDHLDSLWIVDSCGGHKTLFLKFTIFDPELAALPDTLDFGTFCESITKDTTIMLRNITGEPARFTGEILPDPNPHFELGGGGYTFDYMINLQQPLTIRYKGGGFESTYIDSLRITDECGDISTIFLKAKIENIHIDYFPDTLTACYNSDTTRIRYQFSGGTPPFTFLWAPATGLNNSNLQEPTIISPIETKYHLIITDAIGCQAFDSVVVNVIPPVDLGFDPNPLDFGLLDSCETNREMDLEITNNGSGPVEVRDSSTNPSFTIVGVHKRTIEAGQTVKVTVRFVRTGGKSGDIITGKLIFFAGSCDDIFEVDVRAGIKGDIIALDKSGIDFGEVVDCNKNPITREIVISNRNNTLDAEINEPDIVPDVGVFKVVSPAKFPLTIGPLDSIIITVSFTPGDPGTYTSDLVIPFTIGECFALLKVNLSGLVLESNMSVDPEYINFGDLTGCEDSTSAYVTLTNTGTADITDIMASSDENIDFDAGDLIMNGPLKPGGSKRVKIIFAPRSNGKFNGKIKFVYQPCDKEVDVDYEGAKYGINFSLPDTLNLGDFCYGDDNKMFKDLVIENVSEGGQQGMIKDFRFTGDFANNPLFTSDLKISDVIPGNSSKIYKLEFDPDKPGRYEGTLEIIFDPCNITKKVHLTANISRIEIVGMPDTLVICHDNDTTRIRYLIEGGENNTYKWSPTDGLDNPSTREPVIISPQNIKYYVTITDPFGCVAEDSLIVKMRPPPDITFDPDSLDFGTVDSCETTVEQNLKITNNGLLPVTLRDSSSNPSFTVVGVHERTIDPGKSATIKVRFVRGDIRSGTKVDGILYFYALTCGDVLEVGMTAFVEGEIIALDKPVIDFGTHVDCEIDSLTEEIVLKNTNISLPVVIGDYEFTPQDNAVTVAEPAGFPVNIPPGESTNLKIKYKPDTEGSLITELLLPYKMGECTGILKINIRGEYQVSKMEADVSDIAFRDLKGCESVDSSIVRLTNTGSAPIEEISASYDANINIPAGELKLNSPLPPGASKDINVYFRPNSNGNISGTIQFTYQPCGRTIPIEYTGSKFGVNFTVTDSINFGNIVLCKNSFLEGEVNINNISELDEDGTISSVKTSGDFASPSVSDIRIVEGDIIPKNVEKHYTVIFKPDKPGVYSGYTDIVLEPCTITKRVYYTGSATDVLFERTMYSYSQSLELGETMRKDIEFRNNGTAAITVSGIRPLKRPLEIKAVNPPLPAMLKPGETITVTVGFTAEQEMHYMDTLKVYGDDPCEFADSTLLDITTYYIPLLSSVYIPCPADSAKAGQEVEIPLYHRSTRKVANGTTREFEFRIRFNKTLLMPEGNDIIRDLISDSTREVTYRAKAFLNDTAGVLYNMLFKSALGNAQCTNIELLDFKWLDSTIVVTSLDDGCFCLTDICPAYGDRLMNPEGKVAFKSIRPNPTGSQVEITYELTEKGFTKIYIVNLYGKVVKMLYRGVPTPGINSIDFNVKEMSSGSYFIVLETPTVRRTQRLEVVK